MTGVGTATGPHPSRPSRRRRLLLGVAATVAVAAVIVVAGVLFFRHAAASVTPGVRAFSLTPTAATVTFEVDKPPPRSVSCDVRARDRSGAVVGRVRGVVLGPAPQRLVVRTATVPTSAPATSVDVESCSFLPG